MSRYLLTFLQQYYIFLIRRTDMKRYEETRTHFYIESWKEANELLSLIDSSTILKNTETNEIFSLSDLHYLYDNQKLDLILMKEVEGD